MSSTCLVILPGTLIKSFRINQTTISIRKVPSVNKMNMERGSSPVFQKTIISKSYSNSSQDNSITAVSQIDIRLNLTRHLK